MSYNIMVSTEDSYGFPSFENLKDLIREFQNLRISKIYEGEDIEYIVAYTDENSHTPFLEYYRYDIPVKVNVYLKDFHTPSFTISKHRSDMFITARDLKSVFHSIEYFTFTDEFDTEILRVKANADFEFLIVTDEWIE